MSMSPISATLTQVDRSAGMNAVATIKELNADDRKALPKMGDKSRAFVYQGIRGGDAEPRLFAEVI